MILAVVLFGSKLPEVMRNFGKAYSQFRKSLSEFQYTVEDPNPTISSTRTKTPARLTVEEDLDDDSPAANRPRSAPRFGAPPSDDE